MGIREGFNKLVMAAGAGAVIGGAVGEVHGRNVAHDAAIVSESEENKKEAERVANEKAIQVAEAERKEEVDQKNLAEAYSSQLGSKRGAGEYDKSEYNKLAESIVKDFQKWLKNPGIYSGSILAQLSDNLSKEDVRKMSEGNPAFYGLVLKQVAYLKDSISRSQLLAYHRERDGQPLSKKEKDDDEKYTGSLFEDIFKIEKLL